MTYIWYMNNFGVEELEARIPKGMLVPARYFNNPRYRIEVMHD